MKYKTSEFEQFKAEQIKKIQSRKKYSEIYEKNATKKTIYGTTTPEERDELAEEGINLLSIPWVSKDN